MDTIGALNKNSNMIDFANNDSTDSFTFFKKIDDDGTLSVRIMMRLKYLSNFWKTLLMPLIKFEISLFPRNCVKSSFFVANQAATFKVIDTNLYVAVVTLSIQDNEKVLKELKPHFKQILYWNEARTKTIVRLRN